METINFLGNTWISTNGNVLTPVRFWGIALLSDTEYNNLPPSRKEAYVPINKSHLGIIAKAFPQHYNQYKDQIG